MSDPPPSEGVKAKLRAVALQSGISSSEVVIAAVVRAYCWREDFTYCSWWDGLEDTDGEEMPSTLSGRTFPLMLRTDWWDPQFPSTALRVGGLQCLVSCFLEAFPSRTWCESFGWYPAMNTPFVWLLNSEDVVRFQILHGPPRERLSRAARQPVLHRWIANRATWEHRLGGNSCLNWHEHFSRIESDAER
jgi:hypothetical protein